jgi:branched-chain amino acid aminotransferase/4-amino-4-deoxychorismate lyase
VTGEAIDPLDRGFALRDGLFETVLAEAGALRQLDGHLDRLSVGRAVLGLPAGRGWTARTAPRSSARRRRFS